MFLEALSADEPVQLNLALSRGLTVIAGLGPKHRGWLASAVTDAMAGRATPLWGVAQVVNMRVDLGDSLVVRSTAGIDPVIGPEIWRSGDGAGRRSDDRWPASSLPGAEAAADLAAADDRGDLRVAVAAVAEAACSDDAPAPVAEPVGEAASGRRRRWWRQSGASASSPPSGPNPPAARPAFDPPPVQVDERPEVPPPVAVADPPPPPILSEPGPPVPQPLRLPARRVAPLPPEQCTEPPAPPARPPVLDGPGPGDPGSHPGPLVLPPAPSPPPPAPPVDPRFEARVAEVAHEVADRQARLVACRAAAAAAVVPVAPDTAPVAAALAELERRLAEEAATLAHAHRLAGLWLEAQSAVERATMSQAPAWLGEAVHRRLEQPGREVAEAEAARIELQAPRDDAAAAAASARLVAVWAEVTTFLGHEPADVLAALANRSQRGAQVTTAATALAAALQAVEVEPPGDVAALSDAARTWLDGAGERAAAVDAAVAASRGAVEEVRRAEVAVAVAHEDHAEAVASLRAATVAATARRAAAEAAHQQVSARWRQEVDAIQAAHAREIEQWSARVAAYDRWAAVQHEAEARYEGLAARHRDALVVHEQAQREAVAAAQRQADEAWRAAVVALEAEFDRCHATRVAWERQRAGAEAAWQAQTAAAVAERRRLEGERAAALAALAAWEERHTPAPRLPDLVTILRRRVAENHTAGPAGAVPLVIDDALASLPLEVVPLLFAEIAEAAATIQVIYLTDDPDVVSLARSLGTVTVTTVEVPAP